MSEEYKRTKKEVELDLKIKQAELDQKLAEIEKTKAETEKMQSESGKAYLEYEKALGSKNKEVNKNFTFMRQTYSVIIHYC